MVGTSGSSIVSRPLSGSARMCRTSHWMSSNTSAADHRPTGVVEKTAVGGRTRLTSTALLPTAEIRRSG